MEPSWKFMVSPPRSFSVGKLFIAAATTPAVDSVGSVGFPKSEKRRNIRVCEPSLLYGGALDEGAPAGANSPALSYN